MIGKDSNCKSTEEVKKTSPPCPTRKSARVTAGKSSLTSEMKKSVSVQDVSKETDSLEEEVKVSVTEKSSVLSDKSEEKDTKATEEKMTSKASIKESKTTENKTVPPAEVPMKIESMEASVTNIENEKMETDETEKCEETLESLSRDVERLVEEDDNRQINERVKTESEASSDAEMRLTIDEDIPESAPTEKEEDSKAQPDISDNKYGCDQSSVKSPEDVQKVETIVESTSAVQQNSDAEMTAAKPAATDHKSKEATKVKSIEVEEVEEQKENRRVLRTRTDKQKKVETTKSVRVPTPIAPEKSETKVKSEDAATSEVPLPPTQDNNIETKIRYVTKLIKLILRGFAH